MQNKNEVKSRQAGVALLRITLGVIILATWYDNLTKGLYTADGLVGFFNWLFAPDGNASSLAFYKSLLDATVVPVAGLFAGFQLAAELLMGLGLLLGGLTRFFGLAAAFFFFNLFLAYFGGHEWIWTYVLLIVASLTLFLGHAGQTWGIDGWRQQRRSKPANEG